jgi:hypothetical protein
MIGNTYIYVITTPAKPATPSGPAVQCNNNENVTYTTQEVAGATSYTWSLTPSGAGTITGNTVTATVGWNEDFTGTASISVAAVNACFTGPVSNNLSVTVNAAPQPMISGSQDVCDWEQGLIYSSPAVEGNTYSWEVMNGHITDGAGTSEITVTWHDAGTGWVKLTESNDDCTVTTSGFTVAIDDCVGIGEGNEGSFSIYPNPVRDELMVRFAGQPADSRIVVVNQLGQRMFDQMSGGGQQIMINTAEYAKGVYALRVYGENGVTEKKFIKAE